MALAIPLMHEQFVWFHGLHKHYHKYNITWVEFIGSLLCSKKSTYCNQVHIVLKKKKKNHIWVHCSWLVFFRPLILLLSLCTSSVSIFRNNFCISWNADPRWLLSSLLKQYLFNILYFQNMLTKGVSLIIWQKTNFILIRFLNGPQILHEVRTDSTVK